MTQNPSPSSIPPNMAPAGWVQVHPVAIRIFHWLNVIAIVVMVMSGWRIYNASPFEELGEFMFPRSITLGGWLAGAVAWHFAFMWLLAFNGFLYLVYNFWTGRMKKKFFPITPSAILHDIKEALSGKLSHEDPTHYNAVQKIAYVGVMCLIIGVVLTGLAIWKPVQFHLLTDLIGGFDFARRLHFIFMLLILCFIAVHVIMVAIVPKTLIAMITGKSKQVVSPATSH